MELAEITREGPLSFRHIPEERSDLVFIMESIRPMLKKEQFHIDEMKRSWLMPRLGSFLAPGSFNNGEITDFLYTIDDLLSVEEDSDDEQNDDINNNTDDVEV